MHSFGRHLERMEKQFTDRVDTLATQQRTLEQALHTAFSQMAPMPSASSSQSKPEAGTGVGGGVQKVLGRLSTALEDPDSR